jgi:hypothetical protein
MPGLDKIFWSIKLKIEGPHFPPLVGKEKALNFFDLWVALCGPSFF